MVDIILYILIGVLLLFCIRKSFSHFKGEGGCCGGGTDKAEVKKLDGKVIATKTMKIEGMHCSNCANRIQTQLNRVEGISAIVNYKHNQAKVSYDRNIDDSLIISIVEKLGYKVLSLQ